MAKYGYIYDIPGLETAAADKEWMHGFGCAEIVAEKIPRGSTGRLAWESLTSRLQPGDALVLSKLSNALHGARQLVFFLEFCRVQSIRLVSIHDKLDWAGELFPETKASDALTAIALLPAEANAVRKLEAGARKARTRMQGAAGKSASRAERYKKVVSMYLEGFSIEDIQAVSGFRSRSSVFRVLNEACVDLNRGKTKGPLGPRKKK